MSTNDDTLGSTVDLSEIPTDRGIDSVIDLATAAAGPYALEEGGVYAVAVPAGAVVQVIDRDLDEYQAHPRQTKGTFRLRTADSLAAYLAKHELPQTELWADLDSSRITAVIDAHQGADLPAGFAQHRAVLQLVHTPAWTAWAGINGKLLPQVEFSEFIEQRTIDFVDPAGADVLELAQSFQSARSGRFESSQRLNSGETNLVWKEDVQATAGKSGNIAIPDVLELALVPYEGGAAYKVRARLRYRITNGALHLGVVLERPEDVLRDAFSSVVDALGVRTSSPIYAGTAPA